MSDISSHCSLNFLRQANLAIQENRLGKAQVSLQAAQAQLDEKQKELDVVQAQYDAAIGEKQVPSSSLNLCSTPLST